MISKFSVTSLALTLLSAFVTLIGSMVEQKQIKVEVAEQIAEAMSAKSKKE